MCRRSTTPSDIAKLQADANVTVLRARSNSVLFLHMDQFRDQNPFATDKSGAMLPANPFKDRRVRMAISKAINRAALVDRVMEGAAVPAGSPGRRVLRGNSTTEARYVRPRGGPPVARRGGLCRRVRAHHPRADRPLRQRQPGAAGNRPHAGAHRYRHQGYRAALGHLHYAGEPADLRLQHAADRQFRDHRRGLVRPARAVRHRGSTEGHRRINRARYSNPLVDEVLGRAMATIDDTRREVLLREVAEIAMADQAIVPLFHQDNIFATRRRAASTPAPTATCRHI